MPSLPLPQAQLQTSVSGIMAAIRDFHTIFKLLGSGPLSRETEAFATSSSGPFAGSGQQICNGNK